MFQFLSGFISKNVDNIFNNQNDEVTPQDLIDQLKYYVALIEHNNKYSSCFFFSENEINYSDSNMYYLCTSAEFISKKDVESKAKFNIYLGANYLGIISIKLDTQQRKIKQSKISDEFIYIQMFPEMDKIPKDKFLTIKNSNLNEYIGSNAKNIYFIGFKNYIRKEITVIDCKFEELKDNYKMKINLEDNNYLGCSPLCIINQKELQTKNRFKIIGIIGQYNILKENHGYLLGPIVENLIDFQKAPNQLFNNIMNNIINNDNDYNINNEINLNLNNNIDLTNEIIDDNIGKGNNMVDTNIITEEIKLLQFNYFYTFDEYKKHIIKFHNLISKYYVTQTLQNYLQHYSLLENYLKGYPTFANINRKFIDSLNILQNPQKFEEEFPNEIIGDFNKILSSNNLELIEKLSYFIAGIMLGLNTYGIKKKCIFINNGDRLYTRVNLNYEDIKRFESNKDKVIVFKTFLNEITTLDHFQGKVYKACIDSKFSKKNNKFDTQIHIRHIFDENSWKATCFSLNTTFFPEKVFNLFSFFKVKDINIDYTNKEAKVNLENVGIKEFMEERIAELNNHFSVNYDRNENIIEVV